MIAPGAKGELLRRAERAYAVAEANGEKRLGRIIQNGFVQLADHDNPEYLKALLAMKRLPVLIDEFIDSPEFLGGHIDIWPELRGDLREINTDQLAGEERITEAVMGGATGTGKTVVGSITNAYALYTLTCFDQPQRLFGLSRATPIVFFFASVSSTITNRVIYKPFRDLFTGMKYVKKYVEYNKQLEASLVVAGNIMVVPSLASVQSMVGQAVVSGILDEVNFMARVENSKQVVGAAGGGGVYDQAELTYTTLSRRRKGRFTSRGISPGCLCVSSSTRYRGDFVDRRIDDVRRFGEKGTVVKKRKQYETVPKNRFAGPKFPLLVGTDQYPTRILNEEEVAKQRYPKGGQIEWIPIEYLSEFQKDPENALRDIVGVATDAIRPFISQRDKIIDCQKKAREQHLLTLIDKQEVVLQNEQLPLLPEGFKPTDPDAPRFVHIDLAVTHDRCGVAIVRHDGFVMIRGERLPQFAVELAIGIKPDPINQVQIADVREWILRIMAQTKINVVQISYDGFNSKESIQVLKRAGIRAVNVSVDKTTDPYDTFRQAIYDTRVLLPENDILRMELIQLEWYAHLQKVDHPPRGSKDVADAVCGALFAATRHPAIRSGIRAIDADGKPVRTPHTMQRPNARYRPVSKSRPSPSRDRLRNKDLDAAAGEAAAGEDAPAEVPESVD